VQLGFVIDHSRCIGCHACTVACKAENDVPVGRFRTWVKYVEEGSFPQVRRSFAVLRCNQCGDAPCVTICPTGALAKRPDGIVDVDPGVCIGCKACMQACPYDALYLNDAGGTAQKCHFCAHRSEVGLAPACAVVCPTEAIIPGDFDDPTSRVSTMAREHRLSVRKPEAGTRPNVRYREVSAAGIDPALTHAAAGYLWANPMPGFDASAERFEAARQEAEGRASARTSYDVDHARHWRGKVSAYLFTKSLAAGAFLATALLIAAGYSQPEIEVGLPLVGLGFLAATTVLLVADLARPERFLYILLRPNWGSWLARGAVVLLGYGAILGVWCLGELSNPAGVGPLKTALLGAGCVLAALTAGYTGWLFAQARGRVLWMRRGLWLHLIVQALLAGCALGLVLGPSIGVELPALRLLREALVVSLALHLLFTLTESWMAPRERAGEYARAAALLTAGPYAARHAWIGILGGILLPSLMLLSTQPLAWSSAGATTLLGLWVEEDLMVRAGQTPAIS